MNRHELTLERLSAASLAKHLWQQKWIKSELLRTFTENVKDQYCEFSDFFDANRIDFIKKVLKNTEKILSDVNLPKKLIKKVVYVVKVMGEQIWAWLVTVHPKLEVFDAKNQKIAIEAYLNNIIWNDIGFIDWSKTIRYMIDNKKFPNAYMEYVELCFNCLEDDITQWYAKTPSEERGRIQRLIENHLHQKCLDFDTISWDREDFNFFSYWHFRCLKSSVNCTTDELCKFNANQNGPYRKLLSQKILMRGRLDADMFITCALRNQHLGLKYFWNRMDDKSRRDVFIHGFKSVPEEIISCSEMEYGIQNSIFMLQNMASDLTPKFVDKTLPPAITHILHESPWADFSPEIIKLLRNEAFGGLSEAIKLCSEMAEGDFPNGSVLYENFGKKLRVTVDEAPDELATTFDYHIAKFILDIRDLSLYKKIAEHEAFAEKKKDILFSYPVRYFKNNGGKNDCINQFLKNYMEQVLEKHDIPEFTDLMAKYEYNNDDEDDDNWEDDDDWEDDDEDDDDEDDDDEDDDDDDDDKIYYELVDDPE